MDDLREEVETAWDTLTQEEHRGTYVCHEIASYLNDHLTARGYEPELRHGKVVYDMDVVATNLMGLDPSHPIDATVIDEVSGEEYRRRHSWNTVDDAVVDIVGMDLGDIEIEGFPVVEREDELDGVTYEERGFSTSVLGQDVVVIFYSEFPGPGDRYVETRTPGVRWLRY